MSGDIGAVVVNYNAGEHLIACVRSLRDAGVERIVVVDNASTDDSVARLTADDRGVDVIVSPANVGYGGGVNLGTARVDGDFVLVLNADVVVAPSAVKALVDVLDAGPDIGIVGPGIEEVDGSRYPSARPFPRLRDAIGHAFIGLVTTDNPYSRRYLVTGDEGGNARDADWVSGACFLARRATLDAVGGFDEAFFMYLEDVDLCWRAGRAGWRVRYEPAANVTHVGGVSTAQTPYRMLVAHHRSLLQFWWRTTSPPQRVLAPFVVGGLILRLVVMVARRALKPRASK